MVDFKTRDSRSYDAVAASFDTHTEKYSGYAVSGLLQSARADGAGTVVDIGCGTGILTLAAARLPTPPEKTIGVDLSEGMLAFAGEKAARLGISDRVAFLRCDAENLEMTEASADGVISLYAFRHLPDPDKAAREAYRILKPGGRIAVAVGSGPSLLSAAGMQSALARIPRTLARVTGRELTACDQIDRLVDTYLPVAEQDEISSWSASHHAFSGSLRDVVSSAGFGNVTRDWMGREYIVETIDDFWDLQATFSSMARKRIADADARNTDKLKQAFRAECEAVLAKQGKLVYRVGAAIVSGQKPG